MFCENCGVELSDTALFCSQCGHKVRDNSEISSNKQKKINSTVTDEPIADATEVTAKSKRKSEKNAKEGSNTLGIAILAIICLCIVGAVIYSLSSAPVEDTAVTDVSEPETLSPSFTDTIYGINFKIPEGYETFDGTDNQNKGTSITYDRSYLGSDGNVITISVSTTVGNFYWDLSQNRDYDDVEKTINGHSGVLKSSGIFSYVTGEKLVVIQGASEQELESIIME